MSEPSPQSQPLAATVRRVAEAVVPPTDGQLWDRVRADLTDLAALTELYRRWRSPLVLLAYRCGVAPERAEEIVNDAFVRLLRRRERIVPIARAFGYLRRCVERKCWRAHRAERCRAERERTGDTVNATAAPANGDPVAGAELAAAVRGALDGLSPQQRLAAELHYLVGWPESQVAEAMSVKPSTVKEHLDRARAKLRELLAKWNPTAAAGGAVAVGDVLADAASASALPPDRLSAAVAAIVAKAAEAGSRAKLSLVLAGVLALGGVALGGWALTREGEPERAQPTLAVVEPPREPLRAKNLRILNEEVIPRLLPAAKKLALGAGVVVTDTRAFGSEVLVELTTEQPLPGLQKRVRVRLRYCIERRRLIGWSNAIERADGWRPIDPDRPIMAEIRFPIGKPIVLRASPEAIREMRAAFELLPRDDRAGGELLAHLFAPRGGWDENLPTMALPVCVVGNTNHHWLLANNGQLFVRRDFDDGWRLWDVVEARCVAADDVHLYFNRGSDVWAQSINAPTAPERKVARIPDGGAARCMTVAAGWLVVRTGDRLLRRPLDNPNAEWRVLLPGASVWGLAGHGSRVYGMVNDRLVYFDLAMPVPELINVGRGLNVSNLGSVAVWGDRVVYQSDQGELWVRPLSAGPEVEWERINQHPPPKKS